MARGRAKRTERVPFGQARQKLSLGKELEDKLNAEGLRPYWFNDDDHGQRLQDAQNGGYEFVTADGDEEIGDDKKVQERDRKIKKLVGTHKDGRPKYAYLMAIKKEWYEEDQQLKEERNRMVDNAIRGGEPEGLQHHGVDPSKGGTYKKNINYKP